MEEVGLDPQTEAMYCMDILSDAVKRCDADNAIQAAACVFGKVEAAFYETNNRRVNGLYKK